MEKVLVILHLNDYKGQERIFALCAYHSEINKILRELPGAKFSSTKRAWHFLRCTNKYGQLSCVN